MANYAFYQDRKVTCPERTHFNVQAGTYEEAFVRLRIRQGGSFCGFAKYPFRGKPKPYCPKTYTFCSQDVYLAFG
ncbi:hypothetical protein [Porphyromonas sp. COT-108 OH1349]|uniref:hypothetical protein n=1 Tax=Porphyromonas sp. COT-108 OH1349 TaxID=1537504 RepID=UPI001269C5C2|nr:hypothetical protein [Porphyromonas sp. COT-108 OH1349]